MFCRTIVILAVFVSTQGCIQTSPPRNSSAAPNQEFVASGGTEIELDRSIRGVQQLLWSSRSDSILVPGRSDNQGWIVFEISSDGHVDELFALEDAVEVSILLERPTTGSILICVLDSSRRFDLLEWLPSGDLLELAVDISLRLGSVAVEDPATGQISAVCTQTLGSDGRRAQDVGIPVLPSLCVVDENNSVDVLVEELPINPTRFLQGSQNDQIFTLHWINPSSDNASDDGRWVVSQLDPDGIVKEEAIAAFEYGTLADIIVDARTEALVVAQYHLSAEGGEVVRHNLDGTVETLYSGRMMHLPRLTQDPKSETIFLGFSEANSTLRLFRLGS